MAGGIRLLLTTTGLRSVGTSLQIQRHKTKETSKCEWNTHADGRRSGKCSVSKRSAPRRTRQQISEVDGRNKSTVCVDRTAERCPNAEWLQVVPKTVLPTASKRNWPAAVTRRHAGRWRPNSTRPSVRRPPSAHRRENKSRLHTCTATCTHKFDRCRHPPPVRSAVATAENSVSYNIQWTPFIRLASGPAQHSRTNLTGEVGKETDKKINSIF